MNKEDEMLLAAIEDKLNRSQSQNVLTCSSFLDIRQSAIVESNYKFTKHKLWGGYEDAERRIIIFLPEYLDEVDESDEPLAILRVTTPKGSRMLTHRDYLGSILSLGIDRTIIGDIIVRENGADIVVLKSMAEYLKQNYTNAANASLSTEILDIKAINLGEVHTQEKKDTVASLRLDNLIASTFNLSRNKAQEAIKQGIVSLNNMQCTKPDRPVEQGDKIVLRGLGKAILKEIGGTTRKDRIYITIEKYL